MKTEKNIQLALLTLSILFTLSCGLGSSVPSVAPTVSAMPTFSEMSTSTPLSTAPPSPSQPAEAEGSTDEELNQTGEALNNYSMGNIAYNKPDKMQVDDVVTFELLVNPSASQEELEEEISAEGDVETATVKITPRMKVELRAADADAFDIQAIHNNAEQIIGANETTRWAWLVKAKKEGKQDLILTVYRLIKYEGLEEWREVKTYDTKITVEITLAQRITSLDWKWIIPTLILPAFWYWMNNKKKKKAEENS